MREDLPDDRGIVQGGDQAQPAPTMGTRYAPPGTLRPDVVRQLAIHEASIQTIPAMGIEIIAVTEATMLQGLRHQRRYGLVTNGSLIVASMHQRGVRFLASADRRLAIVDEVEILVSADLGPPS